MKKYCKIGGNILEFENVVEEVMQNYNEEVHILYTFTNGDKNVEYVWDDISLYEGNPYFGFKTEKVRTYSEWCKIGDKPYTLISKEKFLEIKTKAILYNKLKEELIELFYKS